MLDLSPGALACLKGEVYGIDASAASVLSRDELHGAVGRSERGRSASSDFQVVGHARDEFEYCAVGSEERPGFGCRAYAMPYGLDWMKGGIRDETVMYVRFYPFADEDRPIIRITKENEKLFRFYSYQLRRYKAAKKPWKDNP